MRRFFVITAICGAIIALGCSKSTVLPPQVVSSTVLRGTVTDSLGNPLDSVAIKIKYNLTASGKGGKSPAKDSISSFTASVAANGIQLNWRTEYETNAYLWQIDRSITADTNYVTIATLPAAGTSSTPHDYTYTDSNVSVGIIYFYRLCLVDLAGWRSYFGPIAAGPMPVIADSFSGCRPVPVIESAQVGFQLAGSSLVTVMIKRSGMAVRSLVNATLSMGTHTVAWDGNDDYAVPLQTGCYRAEFAVTRNDTLKIYAQKILVNISDSSAARVNAYSNQQGAFACSDLPIDSIIQVRGSEGEELGSATIVASVTIYACKQGYTTATRTVSITRNDTTHVNFVLK